MEGLITREEKPSNTEVLGLLLNPEKLKFITNVNDKNIRGICKISYLIKRIGSPKGDAVKIHDEVIEDYLSLRCSMKIKDINRSDQVVDALKHIIEDESKNSIASIMDEIKR